MTATIQGNTPSVIASRRQTRLIMNGTPPDPFVLRTVQKILLTTVESTGTDQWKIVGSDADSCMTLDALCEGMAIYVLTENPLKRVRLISGCRHDGRSDFVAVKLNAFVWDRATDIAVAIDDYLERMER
jgi:hypothetical protein